MDHICIRMPKKAHSRPAGRQMASHISLCHNSFFLGWDSARVVEKVSEKLALSVFLARIVNSKPFMGTTHESRVTINLHRHEIFYFLLFSHEQ